MRAEPRPAPPAIVGYRASNRVTVRLRDVTKVANVIDTLVGAGANDIGGINFTVSQASKLLDEAREKAVADARRKAEIYAKAAGVTLGAPLSISEEGAPVPVYRGKMAAAMAAGDAGGARRRDAVGDGQRVLGDQARRSSSRAIYTASLLRSASSRVSKDAQTGPRASRRADALLRMRD